MSATIATNSLKVEAFGSLTTVPNNPIAELMYYLHCVSTVIEYDSNILTDYKNYDNLTVDELVSVYEFAKLLDPLLFINAGIFIVNPDLLPNSTLNQFYKFTK